MLRQMQSTLQQLVQLALLAHLVACASLQDVTPSYIPDRNSVTIDSVIVETAATFVATATAVGGSSPSTVLQGKSVGPQTLSVQVQSGKTVNETLQELAALSDVISVHPDLPLFAAHWPNDPDFKQEWGTKRIGSTNAWNILTGARNPQDALTVCIIDSGIDYTHQDLKANIHPALGYNAITNSPDPMDDFGHGTHVAGIIAAVGDNNVGVSGVNWNNIHLLSCKFINSQGWGKTSDAIHCIEFCVKHGAKIISNSWDGGPQVNPPLQQAVERVGKAGILFVVAAGNSGINLTKNATYPAAYGRSMQHVVVVGGTDNNDNFLPFSNYDMHAVQLSAPGINILSTLPGNSYGTKTGTSMAAPLVSGAAALLLAAANGTLSPQEVRQRLVDSCEKVPALHTRCQAGGRLRVDWALQQYLGLPLSPPTSSLVPPGTSPNASSMIVQPMPVGVPGTQQPHAPAPQHQQLSPAPVQQQRPRQQTGNLPSASGAPTAAGVPGLLKRSKQHLYIGSPAPAPSAASTEEQQQQQGQQAATGGQQPVIVYAFGAGDGTAMQSQSQKDAVIKVAQASG